MSCLLAASSQCDVIRCVHRSTVSPSVLPLDSLSCKVCTMYIICDCLCQRSFCILPVPKVLVRIEIYMVPPPPKKKKGITPFQ